MKRKPMTAYQVLHAWLETQIGAPKRQRPKGFEMPGERSSAWPETRARAAALVEALTGYQVMRPHLIEYLQGGLNRDDALLLDDWLQPFYEFLRMNPFYPSAADDDTGKTEVRWLTVGEAAERLGVSRNSLSLKLNRLKVSLPFGSFKFEKKWKIHPFDLQMLDKKNE